MTATATKRSPAVILLVEDDPGDQVLTQEAFKSLKVPHELRVVSDGMEALDYLYRRGNFQSSPAPRPDLILLDLNMPRINGQQVAEKIYADPQLCQIPIVVLTTSRRQEDVLRAYGRGVACFISKPLDFQRFLATIQEMEQLIKFTLALKSLQGRTRVTDRQIRRLARRQRQLGHVAETLFEHHMRQIETFFSDREAEGAGRKADAPFVRPAAEEGVQEALAQLGNKILQGLAAEARRPPQDRPAEPLVAREQASLWHDPCDTAQGLCRLARCLESLGEASRSGDAAASVSNASARNA